MHVNKNIQKKIRLYKITHLRLSLNIQQGYMQIKVIPYFHENKLYPILSFVLGFI